MDRNQRIRFGRKPPMSFHEDIQFTAECPYVIRCKEFLNDDIAPLHYGTMVEVLICCDLSGEAVINNVPIRFSGNTIIFIPPQAVHSVAIHKGTGREYVLHVSLSDVKSFIDIGYFWEFTGVKPVDFPSVCLAFDEIYDCVQKMIHCDDDLFIRMSYLLRIFGLLQRHAPNEKLLSQPVSYIEAQQLQALIDWTLSHYTEDITLDDASRTVGFSKNYFCSWFKKLTQKTYNDYLADVRIACACKDLIKYNSISAACYNNGFQNMSYFVKVFKKKQSCTPSQYIRNARQTAHGNKENTR